MCHDSQNGGRDRHPVKCVCSFFKYTNDKPTNHATQKQQNWKLTREDNKLELLWFFTVTQHKVDNGKEWQKSGKSALDF